MLRKRGRIVLVGVAGLQLARDDFFKKELTFQVSASYGPGRYDPLYEDKGHDYPIGFVRWTEQRNFEAILDMLSDGKLNFKGLISHQFSLKDVAAAYELLSNKKESIGVLLKYQESGYNQNLKDKTIYLNRSSNSSEVKSKARIAVIGSGSYALSTLLPALKKTDVNMSIIASTSSIGARHAGSKFSFNEVTADVDSVFNRSDIDAVVIATRHDSHAKLVLKALRANKHVFVEKPLCLSQEELAEIQDQYSLLTQLTLPCPILMVGFNRRFSPQIQRIKSLLEASSDLKSFVITVNAGFIPKDHWTQDLAVGGGRIIGELCHFIDLLQFLSGSQIKNFDSIGIDSINKDTITAHFKFSDGSIGVINYLSNGNRGFPKERIEIFFGGRILCLDNFRKLNGYGFKDFKSMNLWRQDKGHNACISAFINAVHNPSRPPIPIKDLFSTSQISIELSTQN
jgi:predicted dehydrogenase